MKDLKDLQRMRLGLPHLKLLEAYGLLGRKFCLTLAEFESPRGVVKPVTGATYSDIWMMLALLSLTSQAENVVLNNNGVVVNAMLGPDVEVVYIDNPDETTTRWILNVDGVDNVTSHKTLIDISPSAIIVDSGDTKTTWVINNEGTFFKKIVSIGGHHHMTTTFIYDDAGLIIEELTQMSNGAELTAIIKNEVTLDPDGPYVSQFTLNKQGATFVVDIIDLET